MAQYRKKPVVIEAFQWDRLGEWPTWFSRAVDEYTVIINGRTCDIETLEGVHTAQHGDWIIQGVKGELYPCKPGIFALTYEAA